MHRKEAIEIITRSEIENLSSEDRSEQLEVMMRECWEESELWANLPEDLQHEFINGDLLGDPGSSRYEPVLFMWIYDSMLSVTNEYLSSRLSALRETIEDLEGEPVRIEACPCCGCRTLGSRGEYDICGVCWWEDDGRDNERANDTADGPNHISLTQARYNFIKFGIFDPARKDLMKLKEPASMYVRGREFILLNKSNILEVGTSWQWEIKH